MGINLAKDTRLPDLTGKKNWGKRGKRETGVPITLECSDPLKKGERNGFKRKGTRRGKKKRSLTTTNKQRNFTK